MSIADDVLNEIVTRYGPFNAAQWPTSKTAVEIVDLAASYDNRLAFYSGGWFRGDFGPDTADMFDGVYSFLRAPTTTKFHDVINNALSVYGAHRTAITNAYGGDIGKAFFALGYVNAMWGSGDDIEYNGTGCTTYNRLNGYVQTPLSQFSFATFQCPIGCCGDYAAWGKIILDALGVTNRVIEIEGHVHNEAYVGGRWWLTDCNMAYAVNRSRAELATKAQKGVGILNKTDTADFANTYIFENSNLTYGKPQFRMHMGAAVGDHVANALRGAWPVLGSWEGDTYFSQRWSYGPKLMQLMSAETAA